MDGDQFDNYTNHEENEERSHELSIAGGWGGKTRQERLFGGRSTSVREVDGAEGAGEDE